MIFTILSFKHKWRWVFALLALNLLCPEVVAAPQNTKKVQALLLHQSCRMFGDCDVILSDCGLHMFVKKQHLTCLLLPPYKETICYSEMSGKIYRCSLTSFRNAFSTSMTLFSFTLENVKLEKNGSAEKSGLKLVKMQSTKAFQDSQKERYLKHEVSGEAPCLYTALGSDSLPYDHRQADMMTRMYALPKDGLFPIDASYKNMDENHISYVSTGKIEKTMVSPSLYAIPRLKAARSMQETLETGSSNEAIELMMVK